MFGLPLQTHRNLIEVITKRKHLMTVLYARYLSFIQQVQKSAKIVPKMLLNLIMNDVRSCTGNNLRNIMLLTDKDKVKDILRSDILKVKYHPLPEDQLWKETLLDELLDNFEDMSLIPGLSLEEISFMVHNLCVY